jgi:hypothetical protein
VKKKRKIAKLSGESLDIKVEQMEKLKSLFPQVVKDGKVDFDTLKQALGEEIDANGERYGLSWAGKSDCFGHIQQATSATLRPVKDESVDFDHTENPTKKITQAKKVGRVGKVRRCEGCEKFICLDRAFGGNDQLKTNTALQAEVAKIEFKVI